MLMVRTPQRAPEPDVHAHADSIFADMRWQFHRLANRGFSPLRAARAHAEGQRAPCMLTLSIAVQLRRVGLEMRLTIEGPNHALRHAPCR